LLSRIVRDRVSRADSTLGGSAASIRRQALALLTIPHNDCLSSNAIVSISGLTRCPFGLESYASGCLRSVPKVRRCTDLPNFERESATQGVAGASIGLSFPASR